MSLTRNLFLKVLPLCAAIVAVSAPAMAQDAPKAEVSVGYNYLHSNGDSMPKGWYADVAGNVTPAFAVVGQVTGNYESDDTLGVDSKLHTFMGGVRVNARATGGVTPFAHVLVGVAHSSLSTDLGGVTGSLSTNDGALQLGGGVKLMPKNVGVQVGADYLRLFTDVEGTNVFRFAAGVVFGF